MSKYSVQKLGLLIKRCDEILLKEKCRVQGKKRPTSGTVLRTNYLPNPQMHRRNLAIKINFDETRPTLKLHTTHRR